MQSFIEGGPGIRDITRQGIVKEVYIKTASGWIHCIAGSCS
ncbi:hypothetical protein [Micromonospora schwarzwaldensis]